MSHAAVNTASLVTSAKRLVVKIGSALLVNEETGDLHQAWLDALCDDVARAHARGFTRTADMRARRPAWKSKQHSHTQSFGIRFACLGSCLFVPECVCANVEYLARNLRGLGWPFFFGSACF